MHVVPVSIVVPAYNAATTVVETLNSLINQTYPNWEAIVVNDGSTDSTASVVAQMAASDNRIHLINQDKTGVSGARNTGIKHTNNEWLLFLDADDWISKNYLEKMSEVVVSTTNLDAVHCGWARVAPDGTHLGERFGPELEDLFPVLARYCPFAIHACLVRKTKVEEVGNFDLSLHTCEDWDLWQRIARAGARFGAVREVLAFYRMRPNSLSSNGNQFFSDAMRVLEQGHSVDVRVKQPHINYTEGYLDLELSDLKFYLGSWISGLILGQEKDARHLLEFLKSDKAPALEPYRIADSIFEAALLPTCQPVASWYKLWPRVEQHITNFLLALEAQSQATGLAQRASVILERKIVQQANLSEGPLIIGSTIAVRVELTEPIQAIHASESIRHIVGFIEMEGNVLGQIELPVVNKLVSAWVIKDAIAAKFSWQILSRFFEHTLYKESEKQLHDQIGWTMFMQQLWGFTDWSIDQFYNFKVPANSSIKRQENTKLLVVEVSEKLTDFKVYASELHVLLTVGGTALGQLTIPVKNNLVTAQDIRVAFNNANGLELCYASVREALIGKSLTDTKSLRVQLAENAKAHKADLSDLSVTPGLDLVDAKLISTQTLVLGRRPGFFGSTFRRAVFPKEAATELMEMGQATGEWIAQAISPNELADRALYAPELIGQLVENEVQVVSKEVHGLNQNSSFYNREHFETLFASSPDPWKYTSPYEETKYAQTLSMLPLIPIGNALEIACAEGHFTVQLAPRVGSLVAADISQLALDRAISRCSHLTNVSFQQLDILKDPIQDYYDLIVCSEVLYFVGDLKQLKAVAHKIASSLSPKGHLLIAHAHQIIDEPEKAGYDWGLPFGAKVIGETFQQTSLLSLIKEIWTPLYRIQLFKRKPRWNLLAKKQIPELIKLSQQPAPPPQRVEATIRWNGGKPFNNRGIEPVTTVKLPILMYHRVAPIGEKTTQRWRITPDVFEEQLKYLLDAGYYSISWEEWQSARASQKPLPGRAIAITFDDGYLDFFEYAWPLLKKYGFSATVFLVADNIGKFNSWDKVYNEELPLMGWNEIRKLQEEGVNFGSHSTTHLPLTSLSVTEVVRDAARSRTILTKELQEPVRAFAYPYGDVDEVVQHIVGACGYTFGFSCRTGLTTFKDDLLELPRIEVTGSDTFQEFVAKLK